MQIGVVFPQTEIGADVDGVRAYGQAVQDIGYQHLMAYDHVLGADPSTRPGWTGYTNHDMFHEPFVLFGYLAGVTPRMEFVSGVVILPQRQTVLAAKQAAEVDVVTKGKFRFGVGIGWNPVEYEALGMNFHDRGRRIVEQVDLMRRLWTTPILSFEGRDHRVTQAGLNPLPVQQPIPVWIGASADAGIKRACQIADGFFPQRRPNNDWPSMVDKMHGWLREAGRDPSTFGLDPRIEAGKGTPSDWRREVEMWRGLGASHLSVNTMGGGLRGPEAHIERAREAFDVVGDVA